MAVLFLGWAVLNSILIFAASYRKLPQVSFDSFFGKGVPGAEFLSPPQVSVEESVAIAAIYQFNDRIIRKHLSQSMLQLKRGSQKSHSLP